MASRAAAKKEKQRGFPLIALERIGQSVWLDYVDRDLLRSGKLRDLIELHHLKGLTSNPSIFEKAMGETSLYDEQIQSLLRTRDYEAKELYEELAITDIRDVADLLTGVYNRSHRTDGFVSIEVSPFLARSTEKTIDEARRLWSRISRPNLLIKVPGTAEGIPAIRTLISEGINVNVTLLFSRKMYRQVTMAYMEGLELRAFNGESIDRVASVASFFVSRIDSAVDPKLDAMGGKASKLRGRIAIANARMAYALYKETISTLEWRRLLAKGARPQRLLWASTGTKNPNYRDVMYVEELAGPDTVDTLPQKTLEAFEDHGVAEPRLIRNLERAGADLQALEDLGVSLEEITDSLTEKGIQLFTESFDKLLLTLEKKRSRLLAPEINSMSLELPIPLITAVGEKLQEWEEQNKCRRLWDRDATLWTGQDEASMLGWLTIVDHQLERISEFEEVRKDIASAGFKDVVLLGMGGSSLAPEVIEMSFSIPSGFPDFHILDSTDPEQIRSLESRLDLEHTLFIVSSKSGTTLEPGIFLDYFYDRVKSGQNFMAITDPGSPLEKVARERGFRRVFHGDPGIGGRYSALSDFGIIPALCMGLDVQELLQNTRKMVHSCSANVPPTENPGMILGAVLGALAIKGRDKVTLVSSDVLWDLGAWVEQLLAESTGKNGKGLIPVSQERLGYPEVYGDDRIFVYLRSEQGNRTETDTQVDALQAAGHPVVRIQLRGPYSIGQEFFRWELATAVAGSILGIHAFNQPDVEESKQATRALTAEFEKTGALPHDQPFFTDRDIALYANERNSTELLAKAGEKPSLETILKAHLDRLNPGDYFALLAYIDMDFPDEDCLQEIRHGVRDMKRVATCIGFGPRFLHSTGQVYKGGPNTGVFLQITADIAHDLAIPGHRYSFGIVKTAQARGDFAVLSQRGRRCLRVHLIGETIQGLKRLVGAIRPRIALESKR